MTPPSRSYHVVMRYADSFAKGVDTIGEHESVLKRLGSVWLAKFGLPMADKRINLLNAQIDSGVATFLYLVPSGGPPGWTKATLTRVARMLPEGERHHVPAYYREQGLMQLARTWFRIVGFADAQRDEIASLRTASSRRPIVETLAGSMNTMFLTVAGQSEQAPALHQRRFGSSLDDGSVTDLLDELSGDLFS